MEAIKQKLAEVLQEKYDKEFADMAHLLSDAYLLGLEEGKKQAKKEIIDMIKWEETK
jgi:hypothetical protein